MDDKKKSLGYKIGYFIGWLACNVVVAAGIAAIIITLMKIF